MWLPFPADRVPSPTDRATLSRPFRPQTYFTLYPALQLLRNLRTGLPYFGPSGLKSIMFIASALQASNPIHCLKAPEERYNVARSVDCAAIVGLGFGY